MIQCGEFAQNIDHTQLKNAPNMCIRWSYELPAFVTCHCVCVCVCVSAVRAVTQ